MRIVERRQQRGPHIPRWEKVPLAVPTRWLKMQAGLTRAKLWASLRLFKPDTALGWFRVLVRRKWTFKQRRKPGRLTMDEDLEHWIVHLAGCTPYPDERWVTQQAHQMAWQLSDRASPI